MTKIFRAKYLTYKFAFEWNETHLLIQQCVSSTCFMITMHNCKIQNENCIFNEISTLHKTRFSLSRIKSSVNRFDFSVFVFPPRLLLWMIKLSLLRIYGRAKANIIPRKKLWVQKFTNLFKTQFFARRLVRLIKTIQIMHSNINFPLWNFFQ